MKSSLSRLDASGKYSVVKGRRAGVVKDFQSIPKGFIISLSRRLCAAGDMGDDVVPSPECPEGKAFSRLSASRGEMMSADAGAQV
uniref:Uncharacterized protein n=1 Tax=Rodentolepis nana TaxID=102285 RepID=A0A0R3TGB4_RODNA